MNSEKITELFKYYFRPLSYSVDIKARYIQFNYIAGDDNDHQKYFLRIIGSSDVRHCSVVAGWVADDGKSYAQGVPVAFIEALLQ